MSVQKDPTGRRWVAAEVEVPGTPEEVWQAIATGPGVSSWFVPTEERPDGTVVSHFGPGMDAVATKTAWDPPHRFAGEGELGPGAPRVATEWIVEAKSGGTCLVRVVHSLFASTDDWDDQLESIESGWPAFFRILSLYLTYFGGQPSATFRSMAFHTRPDDEPWSTFLAALNLAGAAVGERRVSPDGVPLVGGVVERLGEGGHPHSILLRLDRPGPGIAFLFQHRMGGAAMLIASFYFYGEGAGALAATVEPVWQGWMSSQAAAM